MKEDMEKRRQGEETARRINARITRGGRRGVELKTRMKEYLKKRRHGEEGARRTQESLEEG